MNYRDLLQTPAPISERKPGQKENLAGGNAYKEDPWKLLDRWLLTGSSENSFYEGADKTTRVNMHVLADCWADDFARTIKAIESASDLTIDYHVPIVALAALPKGYRNYVNKTLYLTAFLKVVRTASQLYEYVSLVREIRGGFGSNTGLIKTALRGWISTKTPDELEYQFLKYRNRYGATARDVLRIVKPSGSIRDGKEALFAWVTDHGHGENICSERVAAFIGAEAGQVTGQELIKEFGFTHDMLPGNIEKTPEVWKEAYKKMPFMATLRNLGQLTAKGLFRDGDGARGALAAKLCEENVKYQKLHPAAYLLALAQYQTGGAGGRTKLEWTPNRHVIGLLKRALDWSFEFVPPIGDEGVNLIDSSGSMGGPSPVHGFSLYDLAVFSAIASGKQFTESLDNYLFDTEVKEVNLPKNMANLADFPPPMGGGTDVGAGIQRLINDQLEASAVMIWTDMQSWYGCHPHDLIKTYRRKVCSTTRFIYICLVPHSDGTTLHNEEDPLQFSLSGFTANTPKLISMIVRGEI